ncbi:Na(+)-translocating NADH-quinone reductase subunit A [Desulforhopalus singaporensis]|uniref:Na(+)-translocating NADH-quinone reductase subunit A n=1 Tax=Desulforhopalus singaporensis TaxID=91360 RepID=A0A1H0SYX0_9BACT|nr:Na(+)-translocating NADH-quinone reductase subunit A [Desulforhopalus singaporensis]SDP46735.1 Na+-transporting NADH:ubiquinone oxidoreductase subunit A [Desulforhopalus singaporensis]
MKTIQLKKGLNIPISGAPSGEIREGNKIAHVALLGEDYIGMKPTMLVREGERVRSGQEIFTDKKNEGVVFTAPGCGYVTAINRGEKRKFESIVIRLDGAESVSFYEPVEAPWQLDETTVRQILIRSGLWTTIRTRPYGKVPATGKNPNSLFITAINSSPLAPDPSVIINQYPDYYQTGLRVLRKLVNCPIHYCTGNKDLAPHEQVDGIDYWSFQGPHPCGLPSTHIHFIDPVSETKTAWHIGYQDVICIGHLFATGELMTERIVGIGGGGALNPSLVKTRIGASLGELLRRELSLEGLRIISGSVLSGRESVPDRNFLGRFHDQVSVIEDSSGRSFFNWLLPGKKRFSIRPVFASAYTKNLSLPMNTALWGGRRAIYPLGTYEEVMPLDILTTFLLKAIAVCDTEKSKALGCLELIEEDLSLCGYVCPGKNEFGPDLRTVLNAIERGD